MICVVVPQHTAQQQQQPSYRYPVLFPPQVNGYGLNFGMSMQHNNSDGAQDFASLPPLLNVLSGFGGAGSEHEQNSTEVLDGSGSNPNMSRG